MTFCGQPGHIGVVPSWPPPSEHVGGQMGPALRISAHRVELERGPAHDGPHTGTADLEHQSGVVDVQSHDGGESDGEPLRQRQMLKVTDPDRGEVAAVAGYPAVGYRPIQ